MMGRKLLPINVVSNIVMDIMSLVFDFSMSSPAWGKKQDVFLTLFFFFYKGGLRCLTHFPFAAVWYTANPTQFIQITVKL